MNTNRQGNLHIEPRRLVGKETRITLDGAEGHLHYLIEEMNYVPNENKLVGTATALTAWGSFELSVSSLVKDDGSFESSDEATGFQARGRLYGEVGRWAVREITEAIVPRSQERFTGVYLYRDDRVTAFKTFFDLGSGEKKYFTVQDAYYISERDFAELRRDPDSIPDVFRRMASAQACSPR
jgi:hypothetical protein